MRGEKDIAKFRSAIAARIVQPDTIPLTLTPDGSVVSAILQGFELRLIAGSGELVASAAAELHLELEEGAGGGPFIVQADARYGGAIPEGGEVQLTIIADDTFAQKLIRADDANAPNPEWTERLNLMGSPVLRLVLLMQATRKSLDGELLIAWDTLDLSITA